ncbi:MAG: response regulator, partial [Proteobacteria bacterium]
FTPSGGQVTVSVKRRAQDLQIRVTDTGAGIAPEFLPHVFEAFRQGDGSNTRSTGGLGLGLSIVWKLVHLLGGTIRAESDGLGLGATFVVRLPTSPAPHGRRRESTEELAAVRSNRLRGMKILIVEDTAETREAMAMILRSAESEVTSVANAAEAFAAYLTSPPHVIVSDISMPGEDGFSLMRRIRAHERTRGATSIPAIAVTALAHADDRAMVLESGFDAHLVKPFEAEGLILALVDLLGQDSVVSRRGKSE